MFDIVTDLHLLAETVELECKLAQGQDTGANCQGLLLTYSAILTRTAVVLLGAREKAGVQHRRSGNPSGTQRSVQYAQQSFGGEHQLLGDADGEAVVDGKSIPAVRIPAAGRNRSRFSQGATAEIPTESERRRPTL